MDQKELDKIIHSTNELYRTAYEEGYKAGYQKALNDVKEGLYGNGQSNEKS